MTSLAFNSCATRVILSLTTAMALLFAAGCGSSNNGNIPPLDGSFSNASLKGQYVISQTGIGQVQNGTGVASFSETIVFTADGNKNITVGVDDFDQVGGPFSNTAIPGTYSISNDGTGSLNIGGSNGFNFAITMIDDNHFYIVEQDFFATASGFGEKQDTTAFTAAPSGTFVFKAHDLSSSSRVGQMTIASGAISGQEDFLSLGLLSSNAPVSTTVPMTVPDMNGRGTFTLADGSSFNYYVVNASKFYLMSNSSSGSLEIGQAEAQTGGPFSLATLPAASSYVFGSSGDTSVSGPAAIHSAGVFTSDGAGKITGGSVDFVQDVTVNANLAVTGGTYTLAADGRGTTNLTLSGGTISPQIFWMVNGTRAYFLANQVAAVEDGTFSLQQGAPFTALTSQATFFMDGFDAAFKDRVGIFKPTSGGFNWNQAANSFDVNLGGNPSVLATSGTYQVSSNGRVSVTVNNITSSLVFYLSAPNTGFMVQEDADIGGAFVQQATQ